jgi:hypothetical protein
MRRCGKCNTPGHNSRTCKSDAVVDRPVVARGGPVKQRACGNCGQLGHNRQTCSNTEIERLSLDDPQQVTGQMQCGCGKCGGEDADVWHSAWRSNSQSWQ